MELTITLLLIIFAVFASNLAAAKVKVIPAAFWEIGIGLLLPFIPWFHDFEMIPEVFLFVIISVLMFNKGQHTNIRRLFKHWGSTLSMSVWLALVTIIVVGLVTKWFLPTLSLSLAFILGAIITPTDSVAVSSITSDLKVPRPVMNTLERESLFNDASGLVVFNLGITALVTGYFSILHAVTDFLYVFGGGILLGVILGWIAVRIRLWMIRQRLSGPQVIIPYNLLTPFFVYFAAEMLGVSGILAVVTAGIVHGWQQNVLKLSSSRLQITTNSAWELISSILNGIVFVLLGVSFPEVWQDLATRSAHGVSVLLILGTLLYVVMLVVRFLWAWLGMVKVPHQRQQKARFTDSVLIALSGVHGTITMAMAFSLPLHLKNKVFIERSDLIFVAAVVIILSLLVPTIVLKLVLPPKQQSFTRSELDKAKEDTINAAIRLISQHSSNPNTIAVIHTLNSQQLAPVVVDPQKVNELLEDTKRIEKETIKQMVATHEISEMLAADYERTAALMYRRLDNGLWQTILDYWRLFMPFSQANRNYRKRKRQFRKVTGEKRRTERERWFTDLQRVSKKPFEEISNYLANVEDVFEHPEVLVVRSFYDQRQRNWNRTRDEQIVQNQLLTRAFQEEYTYVQNRVLDGSWSRQLGNQLFDDIANDQMLYIQRSLEE